MNYQPLIYKTTIHSVHFQFILYKICYFSWLNLVCAIPYPKVVIQFYFITLAGEGKVGKKESRRAISRCFFSSLCNVLSSRTYLQAIFSVVFMVLAVSLGLPDCQTTHWSTFFIKEPQRRILMLTKASLVLLKSWMKKDTENTVYRAFQQKLKILTWRFY